MGLPDSIRSRTFRVRRHHREIPAAPTNYAPAKGRKLNKPAKVTNKRPARRVQLKETSATHITQAISYKQAVPSLEGVNTISHRIVPSEVSLTKFVKIFTESLMFDRSQSHTQSDIEAHSDSRNNSQTARARLHDAWVISVLIFHSFPTIFKRSPLDLNINSLLLQQLMSNFVRPMNPKHSPNPLDYEHCFTITR